jgi:hypothetical protein
MSDDSLYQHFGRFADKHFNKHPPLRAVDADDMVYAAKLASGYGFNPFKNYWTRWPHRLTSSLLV